jgi:hypothetical protein
MNYGFQKPQLGSSHYVLGGSTSLPKEIIRPDGQWDAFLPIYEPQATNYETYGCTGWGTENALEILQFAIIGEEPNYDERFPYNGVPIRPPGGDPHEVAEFIRKNGLIPNRPLPPTFDEFCTPTPPAPEDFAKGREWLAKWSFGHEWVFAGD